jgi:hypothetical protein
MGSRRYRAGGLYKLRRRRARSIHGGRSAFFFAGCKHPPQQLVRPRPQHVYGSRAAAQSRGYFLNWDTLQIVELNHVAIGSGQALECVLKLLLGLATGGDARGRFRVDSEYRRVQRAG